MISRREFTGLLAAPALSAAAAKLIDTHVHLFLPEFPYAANGTYKPAAHPLGEYLGFLRTAPVERVVVVHPEPYQDDHRILDYVFAHEPSPGFFKAICLFDPIDPRTPDRMSGLAAKHPGRIVGIRIHEMQKAGVPPTRGGPVKNRDMEDPGFKMVFAKARDLRMAVQFQLIPANFPGVAKLARQFPEVPIVIDHLGRAPEGTPAEVNAMLGARLPNVFMKYSGQYTGDVALARRAYEAVGPDRMICGYVGMNSADFTKWSGEFDRAFGNLADGDREKILRGTARKLFRW